MSLRREELVHAAQLEVWVRSTRDARNPIGSGAPVTTLDVSSPQLTSHLGRPLHDNTSRRYVLRRDKITWQEGADPVHICSTANGSAMAALALSSFCCRTSDISSCLHKLISLTMTTC